MQDNERSMGKFIFLKFDLIYGDRWMRTFAGNDIKYNMGVEMWGKQFANVDKQVMQDAIDICQSELQWPPSIAELLNIIDRVSGVPDWEEALKLAVRKDYQHPAIELARKKVGSFAMQNSPARDLEPKFKAAYAEAVRECRHQNKMLEKF